MTTGSKTKGKLKAAGASDTGKWMVGTVLPLIRTHVHQYGTPAGSGDGATDFYHLRLNLSEFLRDDLGLKGSHVRVLQVLQRLRVAILLERGLSGKAAWSEGSRPHLWSFNMTARPSARAVNQALLDIAEEAMEGRRLRRIQEAKEERLAGQYPTSEAGGSEVEEHHFHEEPKEHEHVNRGTLLHVHTERDGEPYAVTVEYRHHSHKDKAGFHEHAAALANGTRESVEEGLTGDRPALVVRPNRDGRYRELLDAISELRTKLSASLSREEALERELAEARELLDSATDPTVSEAEEVLKELGKR